MTWVSWYHRSKGNKERTRQLSAERYALSKELRNEQSAALYQKKKAHYKELRAAYYKAHKKEYRRREKEFYIKNSGWLAARTATRRLRVKRATPAWADAVRILQFYNAAALMTKVTGVKYHVDHVIPLHGKSVCGLHVEANLQVLPEVDNLRKWNNYP